MTLKNNYLKVVHLIKTFFFMVFKTTNEPSLAFAKNGINVNGV